MSKNCTDMSHEVEALSTLYSSEHVVKNINIPSNKAKIPRIVGWSGPARSSTTALLYLLAGQDNVDRVYFQPLKTLLRRGEPSLDIQASDSTICLKEVFRLCCVNSEHDPIDMLVKAGIPTNNITWITMLRDPVYNFASWKQNIVGVTPEGFAAVQQYTLDFYHKHKDTVKMVPFVYDSLKDNEERVVAALLKSVDLELSQTDLTFDTAAITEKLVEGQAAESEYYQAHIQPSYSRGRIAYSNSSKQLGRRLTEQINHLCRAQFDEFAVHAKKMLKL